MEIKMDKAALQAFLETDFAQVADQFGFVEVAPPFLTMELIASDQHLRPGGTVSGPTMFGLADVCAYFCILSVIGPVGLAVTTNCSIDFMRKPQAGRLLCRMELLKLGRALAVCEGRIYSEGAQDKPVARASLTYSIPPNK
ncbi:PaaI family thioesterase [Octadecabacter sp. 1_MG-2023]|uniref:PaaI family thioesterase n=1 Tax=unclassified Octadecabacter TaxID=196158 RepID=UPI001C094BC6|nr:MULTISPECIES: PaaI family thioesterase [unclassified Octadecabacter]MBU2993343.1 PaaI family thioesterase [Octadecabacter sp. B2R22]MDO6733201.1 PaaI family thioesterase [Octadecabacter sp. 1_MG-2023]